MVIVLLVVWIGWHIVQMRMENSATTDDARAASPGRQSAARAWQTEHTIERM